MRSSSSVSLLLALQSAYVLADASSKRGLCYVAPKHASDNNFWTSSSSDLTWYYNYQASPTSALDNSKLEFVPMLWGATAGNTDTGFLDTVKSQISSGAKINYVLSFNEPDGCANGGSCVDSETAAETWIREIEPLKELGVKLGAPAVTGAPTGFTWLQKFFTACKGKCTPDFIPVHWYGNFDGFASHVGQVNATYENMTMWITEFGFPEQDAATTKAFYNQSISWLDSLSYVTHYSYFGAFRSSVSNVGPNAALINKKGKLTDMGKNYVGSTESGASSVAKFAGWAPVVFLAICWTLA